MAITWFSSVEEGIIIEDDCLVQFSLFRFCRRVVSIYYRDTTKLCIMHISGSNFSIWKKKRESDIISLKGHMAQG